MNSIITITKIIIIIKYLIMMNVSLHSKEYLFDFHLTNLDYYF